MCAQPRDAYVLHLPVAVRTCVTSQSIMLASTSVRTLSTLYEGCQPDGVPVLTSASMQIDPPAVTWPLPGARGEKPDHQSRYEVPTGPDGAAARREQLDGTSAQKTKQRKGACRTGT